MRVREGDFDVFACPLAPGLHRLPKGRGRQRFLCQKGRFFSGVWGPSSLHHRPCSYRLLSPISVALNEFQGGSLYHPHLFTMWAFSPLPFVQQAPLPSHIQSIATWRSPLHIFCPLKCHDDTSRGNIIYGTFGPSSQNSGK